jgi:hypothetical protein
VPKKVKKEEDVEAEIVEEYVEDNVELYDEPVPANSNRPPYVVTDSRPNGHTSGAAEEEEDGNSFGLTAKEKAYLGL